MNRNFHAAALIAAMSAFTILLRFLPFAVFRKKVPDYVIYLGKVLPPAIIGMLVVYCLRNTTVWIPPFGMPELIAIAAIIILQVRIRKSLPGQILSQKQSKPNVVSVVFGSSDLTLL